MAILHGWRTCPRCEGRLENDGARATCRGTCGSVYYANSAPCVSGLVEDPAGRLLLARRAVEPFLGLWDPPGGFLEEGEHPVDGLRRELLEETGLEAELGPFVGAWMDVYGDAGRGGRDAQPRLAPRRSPAGSRTPPTTSPSCAGSSRRALPAGNELAFTSRRQDALAAWQEAAPRVARRRGRATARSRPSAARRSRPRTARRP